MMTASELREVLRAVPDDIPVRLFGEKRCWMTCDCGRAWVHFEEEYREIQEAVTERVLAADGAGERYVLLCAGAAVEGTATPAAEA